MSSSSQVSSPVELGCFRCKRSRTTERVAEVTEKTMFDVFQYVFDTVKSEAAERGLQVPDEFRAKLIKFGIKHNLFPLETMPEGNK